MNLSLRTLVIEVSFSESEFERTRLRPRTRARARKGTRIRKKIPTNRIKYKRCFLFYHCNQHLQRSTTTSEFIPSYFGHRSIFFGIRFCFRNLSENEIEKEIKSTESLYEREGRICETQDSRSRSIVFELRLFIESKSREKYENRNRNSRITSKIL